MAEFFDNALVDDLAERHRLVNQHYVHEPPHTTRPLGMHPMQYLNAAYCFFRLHIRWIAYSRQLVINANTGREAAA